jgi:hypothetical protein
MIDEIFSHLSPLFPFLFNLKLVSGKTRLILLFSGISFYDGIVKLDSVVGYE